MIGEILREIAHEIAARPLPFAAELAQLAALVGLLAWAGRRWGARRLAARRAAIEAALADADRAAREAAALREQAAATLAAAERDAPALVRAAREEAERERTAARALAEAEAAEVLRQAREAAERERERVDREAAERLVGLATETARRYLDEVLGEPERRALTERAIRESLRELEHAAPEP